jgi:hypothetical protein
MTDAPGSELIGAPGGELIGAPGRGGIQSTTQNVALRDRVGVSGRIRSENV